MFTRLAQVSVNIIDQCVAQGSLAREYGGLLPTVLSVVHRSLVPSMLVDRPDSSFVRAYSALSRQIGAGKVKMFPRTEMLWISQS